MATPVEALTDQALGTGTLAGASTSVAKTEAESGARLSPGWLRHALGLLLASSTLGLLSWQVTRPALWLDESASIIATQRSWPHLWRLLQGTDSPLVAYYALLKVLTTATKDVFPHAAAHPELLYRWPSMVAVVVAVWVLSVWLARFCPPSMVLGTGVFLLATAGLSRYGQEARSYAFVLLAAVVSTVLWSRMIDARSRRTAALYGAGYALSIVVMIAGNTLSATLIAAHVVAAVVATERDRRWSARLRTVIAAGCGVLLVAPLAVTVTLHGGGATKYPGLTAYNLYLTFVRLFSEGSHQWLWTGALLPLSILGLTRVFSPKYRFIARIAAAWAVVPPLVLLPALIVKPNLLIGRYLLFVIPGWAILGGLGIVTVYELAHRLTRYRLPAAVLALAVVGAVVFSQTYSLESSRAPAGHSEDIRPGLAAADLPQYAGLPIFLGTIRGAIEVSAYDRADEKRMMNAQAQRTQLNIWASPEPPNLRKARLLTSPRVLVLMRAAPTVGCGSAAIGRSNATVESCLPGVLLAMGYHVESFRHSGPNWTFAVVSRVVPGQQPLTGSSTVTRR